MKSLVGTKYKFWADQKVNQGKYGPLFKGEETREITTIEK